jgi:hypothetical protein
MALVGFLSRMRPDLSLYTGIHVLISLVGILTGFVVLYGLVTSNRLPGWTAAFLAFTAATSLTGFGFPFNGITPAFLFGVVSMVVLAVAVTGLYGFHLNGLWRGLYAGAAVVALYLNVFVLVVQMFQKIPALHALAPQGTEPPFAIAQGVVLLAFIVFGFLSVRRFRPPA